ncbi:MAG TPA: hypothetical protein VD902_01285 [Symbiobacteriaceae bacterium]|nr:hypothetical protein [Symbiobacteriaceae bacterium]
MTMTPGVRKFMLTVHITTSVGWIGAVFAYLALAIVTRTSQDAEMVRAAILALEPIYRFALVPLALASLLFGLVQSLGTPWGLFRHYWVLFKLFLTLLATVVLLSYAQTIDSMVSRAAAANGAGLLTLQPDLLHPGVGLLVLLLTTVLSVYKPRGVTPYGWRKQREELMGSQP